MNIIVQKFGGTSLSTKERREKAMEKIIASKNQGKAVVVVVSAMGRMGSPYATDTLRGLVLKENFQCNGQILDLVMCCGEILSAAVLASELEEIGYVAMPLTGWQSGILTDEHFGQAEIKEIDTHQVKRYLEKDYIVVVCGFQGATVDGSITTLGRGGSDTTATALGVALGAEVVEIYTDVDGIMTADPSLVPSAKIIEEMNYEEVFQMADKGAKVIHPRAVEIAQKANLPVRIKNTLSDHPGTSISSMRRGSLNPYYTEPSPQLITAITHQNGVAQVTIHTDRGQDWDDSLLTALSNAKISIDMINFFLDRKIFVVDQTQCPQLVKLLQESPYPWEILKSCSKVTIVGSRIRGIPGVMATIVQALSRKGIQILQSSDSHATISCLVKDHQTVEAVNTLHEAFLLN